MHLSKLVLVAAVIAVAACSSEQSTEIKDVTKIGSPISHETASKMLGINNATGKQSQPVAYLYGKATIQQILATPGAAGIAIYNAQDDGNAKLVFKPVDASGSVVASKVWDDGKVCPPSCPPSNISSIGSSVDAAKAETWIDTFQAKNPQNAHSFVFGKEAFVDLLSQEGVAGIAFMKGSNASGQDALILVGLKEDGSLLWQGKIWDDGMICPPNCPSGGN